MILPGLGYTFLLRSKSALFLGHIDTYTLIELSLIDKQIGKL